MSKYSAKTGKLYQPGERPESSARLFYPGYFGDDRDYTGERILHRIPPYNVGRNAAKRAKRATVKALAAKANQKKGVN